MNNQWKYFQRIQCNCGDYPKDHYHEEGQCNKCGCTWYYPNDKYIRKMNKLGFITWSAISEYRKSGGLR